MVSSGKGFFNLPLLVQLAVALIIGGIGITLNTDSGLIWQLPIALLLVVVGRLIEFLNLKNTEGHLLADWREASWFYIQLLGVVLAILLSASSSVSVGLFVLLMVNPTLLSNVNATIVKALDGKTAKWPEEARQAFEALSAAKVVILPKSLVMQSGSKVLVNTQVAQDVTNFDAQQLLSIAAGFAGTSNHQIADGFIESARRQSIAPAFIKDVRLIPGVGATGLIDSQSYSIGTASLLTSRNVKIAVQDLVAANDANQAGRSVVFMIRGSELIGYFVMSEELNEAAEWLVYDLADAAKRVVLATSDAVGVANAIAKKLSIEEVFAELSPQQRADLPTKLGTEVFEVTAKTYDQISTLVRLSKRIDSKRKQSTVFAFGYLAVAVILPVVFAMLGNGFDEPVAAAILATVADAAVIYNSKSLGR